MSIVRVGMAENKGYAEGYAAIFGKKSRGKAEEAPAKAAEPAEAKGDGKAEGEGGEK